MGVKDLLKNFSHVLEKVKGSKAVTISVAAAQDLDVLKAIKMAYDKGIAQAILVGDENKIHPILEEMGLAKEKANIIHEPDLNKAALLAVSLVNKGYAQVVMKGKVNSSDFLKAVLDPSEGLRTGRLLSHLAAFEVPGQEKLIFHTDGGMNIAPNLEQKKEILVNSLLALKTMGLDNPYVAVLTANEQISEKMPATTDAQSLVEMAVRGELPSAIIEGPIALDVAVSQDAARVKGIDSKVSGKVDLFLMPNIETGNALGKSLLYYAGGKMAGIILGAKNPVVMTSRAETAEGKLNSIALACLACNI